MFRRGSHSSPTELIATHYGSLVLAHPCFASSQQLELLIELATAYAVKSLVLDKLTLSSREQIYVGHFQCPHLGLGSHWQTITRY